MDLRVKAHSKKTLLIGGAVVLVILGVIFYIGFLRVPTLELPEQSSDRKDIVPEVDLSALQTSVLSRFRSWSVLPVTVGETGRENPFSQD